MNPALMLLLLFDGDGETSIANPVEFTAATAYQPGAVASSFFQPGFVASANYQPGFRAEDETP